MTALRNLRAAFSLAAKLGVAVLSTSLFAGYAQATDFVYVANAAQLSWQQAGDRIYFRNLNQFDATFLGCCYNFHLDLTTVGGRAAWSAMLVQAATAQPVYIGVVSKSSPSAVNYIGNF